MPAIDRKGSGSGRLEAALRDFAEDSYRDFSRFRWAEEREWYEVALFYQRRQWLSWDDQAKRWKPIALDRRNPKPMPVSNYFALTINNNANQLGAALPRMNVQPLSADDADQRAADMAEKAIPAIDRESGMRVLNPLLAKHTVLWGMGVTKDVFDASASTGRLSLPQLKVKRVPMRSCRDCGNSYDVPADERPALFTAPPPEDAQPAAPVGGGGEEGGPLAAEPAPDKPRCPACMSEDLEDAERSELETGEVMSFTRGKITTEVRTIFEIYLPRNCQNPNLAKRIVQRYRMPLGEARRLFPEAGADLQPDAAVEVHEVYLAALRSLVSYGDMHQKSVETVTATECWFDWDELPKKTQQVLEEEIENPDELESWQQLGGYVIIAGGEVMDYGPNPLDGKKPYTFYLWEADPANVYPKGLGVDLVPLQKRLNRLDSLMELGMMTNAAGKWLWPRTQTTEPPSGSPSEVIEYDVMGDGKVAPQFVQPTPFAQACWQMRQAILEDFQQLGLSSPVARGEADGQTAFRGLAYLGAKADEAINTQRALYEKGHELRYEKCLAMARRWWDEPRLARVAGPNGKYMVRSFVKDDLAGDYEVELIPGSSKPRTLQEKQQAFAGLLQAGLVDPRDIVTRQFVLDMANLPELDLADDLQYLKAQRDLEQAKQGVAPQPNPFLKFDVFLKVFVDFILTEEFEELPPGPQQVIIAAAQSWSAQLDQVKKQAAAAAGPSKPPSESINFKDVVPVDMGAAIGMLQRAGLPTAPAPPAPGPPAPAAAPGAAPGNPLAAVPGATVAPAAAEAAALAEGNRIAAH